MKHILRKAIAATAASLAIIAPLPMQNMASGIIAPMTASATFSGTKQYAVEVEVTDGVKLYFVIDRSNNTCELTGSDITVENATFAIPDTIFKYNNTYTVTSIGYNAFRDQTNLRAITAGAKHITRIEKAAFMGCSNLYSVNLFNGTYSDGVQKGTVEFIGNCAFKDCTSLKDSKFIQSARIIGTWAFWGSSLPSVVLRDAYSIGEAAFYNCTNVSSISIQSSHLSIISDFAFYNCCNASYITLHSGVNKIGKHAFDNCDKVVEISIPDTVKEIDTAAFMNCDRLKKAETVRVDFIRDHAFFNCPKMIYFKSSYKNTSLGVYSLGYTYTDKLIKNTSLHIVAPSGGTVQTYADSNGFKFN